jgi:hypothetical protein
MNFFFVELPCSFCIQHLLCVNRNYKHSRSVKPSGSGNLQIKTFKEIRYRDIFPGVLVTCLVP